jgi:2-dehydropantoate 2-reductase
MKVAVLGAGAIGAYVGAALHRGSTSTACAGTRWKAAASRRSTPAAR